MDTARSRLGIWPIVRSDLGLRLPYGGFDGGRPAFRVDPALAFATEAGLIPMRRFGDVVAACHAAPDPRRDLLVLELPILPDHAPLEDRRWSFRGYDVGVFDSESNHWSFLLQDLIARDLPGAEDLRVLLGGFGLLASPASVQALLAWRGRCESAGEDLEELAPGDRVVTVAVYGLVP